MIHKCRVLAPFLCAACTLTAPARDDLVGGASGANACGDGIVDAAAGEECEGADPHCVDCRYACTPDEIADPATRHCYQRFPPGGSCGPEQCTSWQNAGDACEAVPGRHLLVLTDLSEAEFLGGVIVVEAFTWTAGTDSGPGTPFHWDGFPEAPFMPNNWVPGEPSGGTNEDCVVVNEEYLFQDEPCGGLKPYICEWHPAGTPP